MLDVEPLAVPNVKHIRPQPFGEYSLSRDMDLSLRVSKAGAAWLMAPRPPGVLAARQMLFTRITRRRVA